MKRKLKKQKIKGGADTKDFFHIDILSIFKLFIILNVLIF